MLEVPYTYTLSKNARWKATKTGRRFLNPEVRVLQEDLINQIKKLSEGLEWEQSKVWIGIHVQMPTRRSDAINVIDTIADCIKHGIGVDDKWFSIAQLDWEIKKDNPIVRINIIQYKEL